MPVKPRDLPEMTHAELLRHLQLRIEQEGGAVSVARSLGVSHVYLSLVMRGVRNVGPKLLRSMGLRRVTLVIHRYESIKRCAQRRVTIRKLPRGEQTVRIDPE